MHSGEKEILKLEETISLFDNDLGKINRLIKGTRIDQKLEEDLRNKLVNLDQEEEKQKIQLQELATKQLTYEVEESRYWDDILTFQNNLYNLQEKTNYLDTHIKYFQNLLERAQKINVLNDVFNISAEYEVGTINNLKIGRLLNSSNVANVIITFNDI